MADKHINMTLVTVPTAKAAVHDIRASRLWLSTFDIVRLVQKCGIILLVLLLSMAAYASVTHFFIRSVKVVGTSMVPTLGEGNSYLLDVWALRQREPYRNEIVVIRDPADHGLSVKRIIAGPGSSVHFKDGAVFVDGVKLSEPYLAPHTFTFTYSKAAEQFITCGRDQYFVLGDNRQVSLDSRAYGPVPRENVLGVVKLK